MEIEKALRVRTIDLLIKEGRLDEAEEMLKNHIIPNTPVFQERIDALRAEKQAAAAAPGKRRMKQFIIIMTVIFVVTGIVVFAVHSSAAEYLWFFILIGFVFIIPRTYRLVSRGDAFERRLNRRTGYHRPGYGP